MRILPIVLLGGFPTAAHAQVAPVTTVAPVVASVVAVDVTGTYASTWGAMTLQQDGTHVTGMYAYHDGRIDGTLDGNTLRFAWQEDDGAGRGELVRASDGSFVGSWGNGNDDHSGGLWRLTPAPGGALIASLGPPSLAPVADPETDVPSADSAPGPHAGAWSLELAIPIDVTFGSGPTLIGVGGLELGVGKRLTDNWYLGATGDFEGLVDTDVFAASSPSIRLRAGGEARYIFNTGTGSASVNDGPEFAVPRTDWIAARVGAETLDEGSSYGTYGDVSIGTDFWLGHTQIGMYVEAGLSVEPTAAYGTTSSSDDDSTTTGTAAIAQPAQPGATTTEKYIGLGWRFAFG